MRLAPLCLIAAAGLALTGCSADAGKESATSTDAKATDAAAVKTYDNCGFTITVDHTPQRATTMEQGATDTLLLLGAKDQIAGYGHQKDAPPEGFTLDGLKEITPDVPNSEQLRDADTDFILSPFKQSWTHDMAGTREEWDKVKVATYNSNTECPDYKDNAGKSRFDLIERDLTELGDIFGRQDEAAALIKKQKDSLNHAVKAPEGTTFMMLYSSIGGAPYVAGGPSIVTEMGERTGMRNVFGDVKEEWPQVSWEAVAEANPDIIILGDLPVRGKPGDTWQEKVEDLKANPGTKKMDAVINERYIVVPGVTTSASARSREAVDAISAALQEGIAEKNAK